MTDNNHAISNAKGWLETLADIAARLSSDDDETREAAREEAQSAPLSVQVRNGWYGPGDSQQGEPSEYEILLSTGGPALRITGDLDNDEPEIGGRMELQWQDWGTPWTSLPLSDAELSAVQAFVSCFYFGG